MEDRPLLRIRLDGDLKQWIRTAAAENRRSMNAEINFQLEQARKQSEPAAGHKA